MFGLARDPADLLKVDLFWTVIEIYKKMIRSLKPLHSLGSS